MTVSRKKKNVSYQFTLRYCEMKIVNKDYYKRILNFVYNFNTGM